MNTVSASPAEAQPRTLVWDAPVRVFHWLLAASFGIAWLTAESERWQLVHITAGYTMAGLVVFRLLWGLVGTRHARFRAFIRGPRAVLGYFRSILRGRPEHHVGHNPAGALAILALLALTVLTVATGWANYNELGGHGMEELHEGMAATMLALVGVHVAAVIASSLIHRENLVTAMIHGRKPVAPREGIRRPWRSVAVVLLAAVVGFWAWQWQSAPTGQTAAALSHQHEDND